MTKKKGVNRREVLQNMSVVGALSAVGFSGTASATSVSKAQSDELDDLLNTDQVRSLHEAVPGLELRRSTALVVSSDEPLLTIEANYGKLVLAESGNSQVLRFYFSEYVSGVEAHWPKDTTGHMIVTSDDLTFQRTPTKSEKEAYLKAIDKSELIDEDSVWTRLTPSTGEVVVTHINENDKTVTFTHSKIVNQSVSRSITATSEKTELDLVVTKEETYGSNATGSRSSGTVGIQSHDEVDGVCVGCDGDVAADVLVCLSQVSTCGPCLAFATTGPLIVACIFIVCLGINSASGVALFLEDVSIPGCTNLAGCIGACIGDWFDQYTQVA